VGEDMKKLILLLSLIPLLSFADLADDTIDYVVDNMAAASIHCNVINNTPTLGISFEWNQLPVGIGIDGVATYVQVKKEKGFAFYLGPRLFIDSPVYKNFSLRAAIGAGITSGYSDNNYANPGYGGYGNVSLYRKLNNDLDVYIQYGYSYSSEVVFRNLYFHQVQGPIMGLGLRWNM
jgi:hypothetical protein